MSTYKISNTHFALIKVKGQVGGYLGIGKTAGEAIDKALQLIIKDNKNG